MRRNTSRFYLDRLDPCKYTLNMRPGALKVSPYMIYFARQNAANMDRVLQLRRQKLNEQMIRRSLRRAGNPKTDMPYSA